MMDDTMSNPQTSIPPAPPNVSYPNSEKQQETNDYSYPTQAYPPTIKPLIDSNFVKPEESPNPHNDTNFRVSGEPEPAYAFSEPQSPASTLSRTINQRYQLFLDQISPHWKARWAFSIVALVIFMARVLLSQGWYVICYALAIYYLNLLIGFISPKVDPSLYSGDDDADGPMLPTHSNDEFKPFIRRLPEFKFWISGTKATLLALFLTLFELFDVPVFWPILLIYFIILFACTMRQQIKHMIRYSYVPWDSGKKRYTGPRNQSQDSSPTTV